jgi:thioredoxin reductase (NADPH)
MRQKRALLASSVTVACLLAAAMTRRRGHKVAVIAKPVLVVVDGEDTSLQAPTRELESRYGAHYQVASCSSAEVALARLAELKAAGGDVPLVLADQQTPGMSGTQLLVRVRENFPTARRGLFISWSDRSGPAPFLEAAALGWLEFYLPKPSWSPDEQFHRVITGSLEEWWREQGGRFEAVTVIGDDPSARTHEIRDLLARNNVPFGFYPSDSPEGRAVLRRLGVGHPAGPVLSLYTGVVLVDPTNTEVAEALGQQVRPAGQVYDVVIVGARPGRVHGSGIIWDSPAVSAVVSWLSAPTNRHGCSAPTSCTATRRRR